MDALKITDQARALSEAHGTEAEAYVRHHLDAAEAVGLEGAVRDWQAVLAAMHRLRGETAD
jgi:hypothetical protein